MLRDLLELVPYLLLFLIVRSAVRGFLTNRRRTAAARPPEPIQSGGELKKDPVCGTYVSAASSFTRTVNGQLFHFCSKECRDRYS
jgi:YHS domain-containing protein